VTIWAITSMVSGSGDQGADPNKLVAITDPLTATSPAADESFRTIRAAGFDRVLRCLVHPRYPVIAGTMAVWRILTGS
jgi:hypothetical protein